MTGIAQSVGGILGAGVRGLMDMAEGYMHIGEEDEGGIDVNDTPRPSTAQQRPSPPSSSSGGSATSSAASSMPDRHPSVTSALSALSLGQASLIQTTDVSSGWIHLQNTYLDVSGAGGMGGSSASERRVRSFGVRNLVQDDVEVEVASDLGEQLVFWVADDDRASYSTTSSASNSTGASTIRLIIPGHTTSTVHLAFTPSRGDGQSSLTTPPVPTSPIASDGGFTPRVMPALSRHRSSEVASLPLDLGSTGSATTGSESDSISVGSSQSVAGSFKAPTQSSMASSRRPDPVHRAFSLHGSITLRAALIPTSTPRLGPFPSPGTQSAPLQMQVQILNLPFFATVCRSLFTAGLIDPTSGLVVGTQQSSGQMMLDFGTECVVGQEYHRDILLVNRSEIELVWMTAVVNSRYKDQVWFSLRDLDSENVFGVDTSSQPVPLPSLSSRHLRLILRVKAPVVDFGFDFVISNVHQSGNLVTCRATGSGQPESADTSLRILGVTSLDFGQVTDGVWAKKLITCRNAGDKGIDVRLSASEEVEVCFRLAGVAGDDMDEDVEPRRADKDATVRARDRDRDRGRSAAHGSASPLRVRSRATSPASMASGRMGSESNPTVSSRDDTESHMSFATSGTRDLSLPPSRPLSRVASRSSSYKYTDTTESDAEAEEEPPFLGGAEPTTPTPAPAVERTATSDLVLERTIPNQIEELSMRPGTEYRLWALYRPKRDTSSPTEIAGRLRPSSFKVFLDVGPRGSDGTGKGKASTRRTIHCSAESCTSLIAVSCTGPAGAEAVQVSGATPRIDFGEVTVGASKAASIKISNLSDLSAKVEIAAISKVLSTNRNVIVIPPNETVEEKIEFFPRRINERYEKQVFVRNLLNRGNDRLVEIRSKNVDVNNVTLHSHLYRILTPNGANFLDFGQVVINAPTVRTVQFENLTFAPLALALSASQTEDIELYVKLDDAREEAAHARVAGGYADEHDVLERVTSPPGGGDLKERFMETLREIEMGNASGLARGEGPKIKAKKGEKGEKEARNGHGSGHGHGRKGGAGESGHQGRPHASRAHEADGAKLSVGAAVAAALRKGGRGRPVLLYGNAVMFKDRSLLDEHEHLDLAAGPPISAHRTSPRSKKSALLDTIELEDKSKLSGQHPKVPKLDFAASAKASGLLGRRRKPSPAQGDKDKDKEDVAAPTTPTKPKIAVVPDAPAHGLAGRVPAPSLGTVLASAVAGTAAAAARGPITPDGGKSPALTGKRAEPLSKAEMFSATDVSKMSLDELLVALEQHDAKRAAAAISPSAPATAPASSGAAGEGGDGAVSSEVMSLEDEEQLVRRTIALRKELQNLVSTGRLVPARTLRIPPKEARQLVVVMTPNGSIRPHVAHRPKRADSRLFIRLMDFDRSFLATPVASPALPPPHGERPVDEELDLPVRDLIVRSACVRSTLEVQQTSINFGVCEKGEVKSRTIVIQNKSDTVGLFRLRTSGSIASGDLKLGLGRYGVITAFGRKEVQNFSFTPSLVGDFRETIVVENVLDSYQDQNVYVKANVRKQPTFTLDSTVLDFGEVESGACVASGTAEGIAAAPASLSSLLQRGVTLTNVSKSERTFVVAVTVDAESPGLDGAPAGSASVPAFAQVHLARDESAAGVALSKAEEEEAEGLLQKLKIARRKGKADKVGKYEARLGELGVEYPTAPLVADVEVEEGDAAEGKDGNEGEGKVKKDKKDKKDKKGKDKDGEDVQSVEGSDKGTAPSSPPDLAAVLPDAAPTDGREGSQGKGKEPAPCVMTLTVTLPAQQKTKILVELRMLGDAAAVAALGGRELRAMVRVHERKNTDETVGVVVCARIPAAKGTTSDPLHLSLMRHCLELSEQCEVSPTAFSVGSTLFLPLSSPHYALLVQHFPAFALRKLEDKTPQADPVGLILGDGYSRQIPGNTHAEANALANFRSRYAELQVVDADAILPAADEVLRDTLCYATMEPCSVRTSGGPSCALELVRAHVRTVYLGVEEPADYVVCEGVNILEQGGVEVVRVKGLEVECLAAARRGIS